MTLRRGVFSRQSIFAIVNHARFIPKLQRHLQNAEVLRDADAPDSQNLRYVTRAWIKRLKEANVPEAEHSVKIITEHIVGKERLLAFDLKQSHQGLTKEEARKLNQSCQQRLQRVPVQYIIGEWDFRYLTLAMKQPVFIPRPETEELIDLIARHHSLADNKDKEFLFLEVGCGSGAICLSILSEFPQTKCVAIDKSEEAISLTKHNAGRCNVCDRISLYHADVESVLSIIGARKFDAVISNPPYIPAPDMALLQPEVSRYEDMGALHGGLDGLHVVKRILRVSPGLLKPDGSVWLEVDISHPEQINQWISSRDLGLKYSATFNDFTQRPRFCHITRKL